MAPVKSLPTHGIYAVTACHNLTTRQLLSKTERILQLGVAMLQYRHKEADPELKRIQAGLLQKLCEQYAIPFIINDEPGLARELRADGAHIGREDMDCRQAREMLGPDCIIGVSCYNELDRATAAAAGGASYIAFGAFFPTPTKPGAVKAEPAIITRAKHVLTLPVVAIGGITPDNGRCLVDAGADFLAVSSGLYTPAHTVQTVRKYQALFNKL